VRLFRRVDDAGGSRDDRGDPEVGRWAAFPAPRLRGHVGRAAAVGKDHPCPRRRDLAEPGLRRGVRVRAAPLPPGRRPWRVSAFLGHRAAPRPTPGPARPEKAARCARGSCPRRLRPLDAGPLSPLW